MNMHAYLEGFANLFYHVDSAREDVYFRGVDLEYYRQMEWRIISGMKIGASQLDRMLTDCEIIGFEAMNSFFGRKVQDKEGQMCPRSRLLRLITHFDGHPFRALVRRVWIPETTRKQVEQILNSVGLSIPIMGVDFEEIQKVRCA